jgi:hypothetical protein
MHPESGTAVLRHPPVWRIDGGRSCATPPVIVGKRFNIVGPVSPLGTDLRQLVAMKCQPLPAPLDWPFVEKIPSVRKPWSHVPTLDWGENRLARLAGRPLGAFRCSGRRLGAPLLLNALWRPLAGLLVRTFLRCLTVVVCVWSKAEDTKSAISRSYVAATTRSERMME